MNLDTLHLFCLVFAIPACLAVLQSDARSIEYSVQCNSCYDQTNKDILSQSPHDGVSKCWESHNYTEVRNAIFWWETHIEYVDIATVLIEMFKMIIPCADDTCAIFKMFLQPKTNHSMAPDFDYRIYEYLRHSGTLQGRRRKRYDTPKEVLDILPLLSGISEPCLHKIIFDHRENVKVNLFKDVIEAVLPTTKHVNTVQTTDKSTVIKTTAHIITTEKNTTNLKTTVTLTSSVTTTTMSTPSETDATGVPVTTPPVRCTTCSGIQQCVISPITSDCGYNHLCYVTVVDQTSGSRHIEKGCKSIPACFNEWWQETSDTPICLTVDDGSTGEDITCTFCCSGDKCNSNKQKLVPAPLYNPAA